MDFSIFPTKVCEKRLSSHQKTSADFNDLAPCRFHMHEAGLLRYIVCILVKSQVLRHQLGSQAVKVSLCLPCFSRAFQNY